jgi:hypothetical protein
MDELGVSADQDLHPVDHLFSFHPADRWKK